jgi:hypothetical protein
MALAKILETCAQRGLKRTGLCALLLTAMSIGYHYALHA